MKIRACSDGTETNTNGFTIGGVYDVIKQGGHQDKSLTVINDNGDERVLSVCDSGAENYSAHIQDKDEKCVGWFIEQFEPVYRVGDAVIVLNLGGFFVRNGTIEGLCDDKDDLFTVKADDPDKRTGEYIVYCESRSELRPGKRELPDDLKEYAQGITNQHSKEE